MAAPIEDFEELLSSEVTVPLAKLREFALQGIPEKVRGEVWLYLLDVVPPSKALAVSAAKDLELSYETLDKTFVDGHRVTFEWQRLRTDVAFFQDDVVRKKVKNVMGAYYNVTGREFNRNHVKIIAPLAMAISDEAQLFGGFKSVMEKLSLLVQDTTPHKKTTNFARIMRARLPSMLAQIEEDDDVDFHNIFHNWLEGMLTTNLPVEDVQLLWDVYVAKGFWFHPYVCMSILEQFADSIEELDQQEDLKHFISYMHVPNIHEVLVNADNIYSAQEVEAC